MNYVIIFSIVIILSSCSSDCNRNAVIKSYNKLLKNNRQLLSKLTIELGCDSLKTIEYYDYLFIVNKSNEEAKRYKEAEFKKKFKNMAFICDFMKNNSLQIIYNNNGGLQLESYCGGELHPRIILSNETTQEPTDKTMNTIYKEWKILNN